MINGTDVFGPLADDYARYRPGYPEEVLGELRRVCGLTRDWAVADIGSGTGNLARLFLAAGHQVAGVEPNRQMREAGDRLLSAYPRFRSLDGPAERIPLGDGTVDLVVVGQALHWFDIDAAREEFRRILRPPGWVAVLWNDRLGDATAFARAYVQFTRECTEPSPCPPAPFDADTGLRRLYGSTKPHSASFPHRQSFDLEGLLGRSRSSGYVPQPEAPGHAERTAMLTDVFHRHQHAGTVEFHYIARLHCGCLG